MIRYTTPTQVLVIKGHDLSECDVTVRYRQAIGRSTNANVVDITDATVVYDGTETTITVQLTQEQTGGFVAGKVQLQVNWLTANGERWATKVVSLPVEDNLLQEVMENAG